MFLETMEGEIINAAFLHSISVVIGDTEEGDEAWAIYGYYAPETFDKEPDTVPLGFYLSEKDANEDYDLFRNALIAERRYFRFGKIYET